MTYPAPPGIITGVSRSSGGLSRQCDHFPPSRSTATGSLCPAFNRSLNTSCAVGPDPFWHKPGLFRICCMKKREMSSVPAGSCPGILSSVRPHMCRLLHASSLRTLPVFFRQLPGRDDPVPGKIPVPEYLFPGESESDS